MQTQPLRTNSSESIFNNTINIGTKKVKVRKWKAKDRKNFKLGIKKTPDNADKIIKETLVYSCIEDKNIALTPTEIQYLFIQLRKLNIGPDIIFEYICDNEECQHNNKLKLTLDDVCTPNFIDSNIIKTEKYTIELQPLINKKFYDDNHDEFDDIKEIAFRVKSINVNESMSFNEVIDFLDDMDINDFEEILEQFNSINFSIDNTYECICEKCKNKVKYEFDEIPGFFPDSWS